MFTSSFYNKTHHLLPPARNRCRTSRSNAFLQKKKTLSFQVFSNRVLKSKYRVSWPRFLAAGRPSPAVPLCRPPPSTASASAALRPLLPSASAVQGLLPGRALAPAGPPCASAGRRYPSHRTWRRCPPSVPGAASLPLDLPPSRSSSCFCRPRALKVELHGQVLHGLEVGLIHGLEVDLLHGLEVELLHGQSSTASRSSFSTAMSSRRLAVSLLDALVR
jgi:hypothetical protein